MSPISSPSSDSFVGVPVAQGSVSPDVNWLMTWLGQEQPVLDESEDKPLETREPTAPRQMQWLTLLPMVPSMQALPAPVAMDTAPLEPSVSDEEAPKEENTSPAVVDVVQPLIAVPGAQPVIAAIEPRGDTGTSTTMEPRKAPMVPQPAEKLPSVAAKADKGELIWAADFVVAEKTREPVEIESLPQTPSEPAEPVSQSKAMPVEPAPRRDGSEPEARQHPPSERREGEKPTAQPEKTEPTELVRVEAAPVSVRSEPGSSRIAAETPQPPSVGTVELDTVRPLRPTQIATLYVDVPAAAGSDGEGTIRLAITQRGEQVNVRLRSWDAGVAPIDNERMQPLLQSLSEQGYEATKKSIEQLDDRAPQAVEKLAEKPLATAETANSGNDQQSFQNADDRQRKNQERQQQAFLLRRQTQYLNTEQFDLQAQLDGFNPSQHQGAVR